MDTSAMVEFKINAEGTLEIDGGTVLEFDDRLPTHRALDVVREMEGDIRAKVEGRFTDGDRYRALRAMMVLAAKESPFNDRIDDRVRELGGEPPEEPTEEDFDRLTDFAIQALNELVAEVNAKAEAEQAERTAAAIEQIAADASPSNIIYIPEPRKLRVPETTLIDPTDA